MLMQLFRVRNVGQYLQGILGVLCMQIGSSTEAFEQLANQIDLCSLNVSWAYIKKKTLSETKALFRASNANNELNEEVSQIFSKCFVYVDWCGRMRCLCLFIGPWTIFYNYRVAIDWDTPYEKHVPCRNSLNLAFKINPC